MLDKKGAIELSMTTIIVIVLGVTLLVLGLTFVRTIFERMGEISKDTFDSAQDMLGGIEDVDQFLTVTPNMKNIEKGGDGAAKVIIANLKEAVITVNAEVFVDEKTDPNLKCQFLTESGAYATKAGPYTINSGSQKRLALVIKDNGKGPLRTTGCSVTVTGEGIIGEDTSSGVIVKVVSTQKI